MTGAGPSPHLVGVVDIGTNSMRMLITDGVVELGRWEEVTGLGRGVDGTGALSDDAVIETLQVLRRYGSLMDHHGVARRAAIATSASRQASNREMFFDLAEEAIGVRPTLITGEEEARFAYSGATHGVSEGGPHLVSDIGGGSTELVTADTAISIDIGSVRLTERSLPSRPAPPAEIGTARELVGSMFAALPFGEIGALIGVAGTWVELPGLSRGHQERIDTHGMTVSRDEVAELIERLGGLSVEETARLPSLNPERAPVILAGAIIAEGVMEAVGLEEAVVSVQDTLDGVALSLSAHGQ